MVDKELKELIMGLVNRIDENAKKLEKLQQQMSESKTTRSPRRISMTESAYNVKEQGYTQELNDDINLAIDYVLKYAEGIPYLRVLRSQRRY